MFTCGFSFSDPDNFELLLMKIFVGSSYGRLQKIKIHLNELEVFDRNDLLNITENQLNNGFFSESEIKKIGRFLESREILNILF